MEVISFFWHSQKYLSYIAAAARQYPSRGFKFQL
jgi:hypothetical protein